MQTDSTCDCRQDLESRVTDAEKALSDALPPVARLTLDDSLDPQHKEALVAPFPGEVDALWLLTIRRVGAECRLCLNHMLIDTTTNEALGHSELRPIVDAPFGVLQHFAPKLAGLVDRRLGMR